MMLSRTGWDVTPLPVARQTVEGRRAPWGCAAGAPYRGTASPPPPVLCCVVLCCVVLCFVVFRCVVLCCGVVWRLAQGLICCELMPNATEACFFCLSLTPFSTSIFPLLCRSLAAKNGPSGAFRPCTKRGGDGLTSDTKSY